MARRTAYFPFSRPTSHEREHERICTSGSSSDGEKFNGISRLATISPDLTELWMEVLSFDGRV
jgi:hypothetical protein